MCPKYLGQERAVYSANIAAAYLKLEKWKEAEEAATSSLIESGDEKPISTMSGEKSREEDKNKVQDGEKEKEEDVVEEIRRDDVVANWKARLRRAKAREMVGSWASLQDSLEGEKYHKLFLALPPLPLLNE